MFVTLPLASKVARTAFKDRLSSLRDLLSPLGGPKLDNLALMTALLDLEEASHCPTSAGAHSSMAHTDPSHVCYELQYMIHTFCYESYYRLYECTGDSNPSDQDMLIVERLAFKHL